MDIALNMPYGPARSSRNSTDDHIGNGEILETGGCERGRVLLVRRKHDGLWMFPGGRKRARESDKDCLRREIKEELPKLKLGRLRLGKEVKAKNRRSGRKMSDAIFVTAKASGRLTIGDKHEIDKATWRKPRGIRLTSTSRYIRDKLFPKSN
jgi:8-oxo-dGTP diphosphatase